MLTCVPIRVDLENMLGEICQIILNTEMHRIGKFLETESKLVVARSWGKRKQLGVTANGCGVSF